MNARTAFPGTLRCDPPPVDYGRWTDFAREFIETVRHVDLPDMHPVGASTVWSQLVALRVAAERGDVEGIGRG